MRQHDPGQAPAPVRLPEPGIRLRYLYAMWTSCEGWEAKGALVRVTAAKLRARLTAPR